KQNKKERAGFRRLLFDPPIKLGNLAASIIELDAINDENITGIRDKQQRYESLVKSNDYLFGHFLADAWCAAFVWKKTREFDYPITEARFREIKRNPFNLAPWMRDEIRRLAGQSSFFPWHLAFPEVFRPRVGALVAADGDEVDVRGWEGGFDCVLGNP